MKKMDKIHDLIDSQKLVFGKSSIEGDPRLDNLTKSLNESNTSFPAKVRSRMNSETEKMTLPCIMGGQFDHDKQKYEEISLIKSHLKRIEDQIQMGHREKLGLEANSSELNAIMKQISENVEQLQKNQVSDSRMIYFLKKQMEDR
jgi:hypothetical protein